MDSNAPDSRGFRHLDVTNPDDLRVAIESGVVWSGTQHMQQLAVQAIMADPTLLNDKCPPAIAEWIRTQSPVNQQPA